MLHYLGRPDRRPPLPPFFQTEAGRWVIRCWAIPLVVGFVVFLIFLPLSRTKWMVVSVGLVIGGIINVIVGSLAALSGLVVTVTASGPRWRQSGSRWAEVVGPALGALVLLASNFIVAWIAFPDTD